MKTFSEFLIERNRFFRLDTGEISDDAKVYNIDSEGNSGTLGSMGPDHNKTITGLFADQQHLVAPYAAGRNTPFIMVDPIDKKKLGNRGTIYFNESDKETIKAQRPILSEFSKKQGFRQIKSGEWIKEGTKTPKAIKKTTITDPLKFISHHHDVVFVPDINEVDLPSEAANTHNVTTNLG
jgi:hypothetical protein